MAREDARPTGFLKLRRLDIEPVLKLSRFGIQSVSKVRRFGIQPVLKLSRLARQGALPGVLLLVCVMRAFPRIDFLESTLYANFFAGNALVRGHFPAQRFLNCQN